MRIDPFPKILSNTCYDEILNILPFLKGKTQQCNSFDFLVNIRNDLPQKSQKYQSSNFPDHVNTKFQT